MKYVGKKSSDAEMVLDFKNNKVLFDYSLNTFGNPLASNTSCTLHKEISKNKYLIDTLLRPFYLFPLSLSAFLTHPLIMKIISQHKAQKLAKDCCKILLGHQDMVLAFSN